MSDEKGSGGGGGAEEGAGVGPGERRGGGGRERERKGEGKRGREKRARFERATECLRVRGITPPCVSSCANACILAGAQLRRKGGSGGSAAIEEGWERETEREREGGPPWERRSRRTPRTWPPRPLTAGPAGPRTCPGPTAVRTAGQIVVKRRAKWSNGRPGGGQNGRRIVVGRGGGTARDGNGSSRASPRAPERRGVDGEARRNSDSHGMVGWLGSIFQESSTANQTATKKKKITTKQSR